MVFDLSGRGPSGLKMTMAGLALLTAVAVALYLLLMRYTGHFTDKLPVTAALTSTGDGLPAHADVKFRGMLVGSVDSVEIVAKGQRQRAKLSLKPDIGPTIPANVTARIIPDNIFGVSALELVDNPGRTGATLRSGATIPEDTGPATTQLQTTLNVLRNVLNGIQPEKLGRVLGTLSTALDSSARVPGSTIERLDTWMTQVHDIPGIGDLLGNLGRSAAALSASAPELVGVLNDSVTTARTLTERRGQLVALLTDAGATVDTTNSLFAHNPNQGKVLVSGLDGVFGGLSRDPQAIPQTLANMNSALHTLQTAFRWGPSKHMVWSLDVSLTPFRQYTEADCPHYGAMYGPRCGHVAKTSPPQQFPAKMLPDWLPSAGPRPVPAMAVPGLPQLPGLPAAPGLPQITLPQLPGRT
ncbi:MAG: MCE family protein, partial [Nocardia sp.]|nr:MCE family protein [Nocardia sp.]